MPYLDTISTCPCNVYQALSREPGDEAIIEDGYTS